MDERLTKAIEGVLRDWRRGRLDFDTTSLAELARAYSAVRPQAVEEDKSESQDPDGRTLFGF